MTLRNWSRGDTLTLGVFLNGAEIRTLDRAGSPVVDDTLPRPLQRVARGGRVPAAGGLLRAPLGARAVHRRAGRGAGATVFPARGLVPVEGRALVILRRIA